MYWDHVKRGGSSSVEYYWDDFTYVSSTTRLNLVQDQAVLLFKMQPVVLANRYCNYVYFVAGKALTYDVPPDTYYLVIGDGSASNPFLYFKDEDGNTLTMLEDRYAEGSADAGSSLLLSLFPADAVVRDEDPYADLV